MKKIMFNDQCGLTKAVLEGKKTQTRRLALNSEDTQVFNLYPEDKSIQKYVIARYSRYAVGEILAVAQSYENIHLTIADQQQDIILFDQIPKIRKEGVEKLIQEARNNKVSEVIKNQNLSPIEMDSGPKEEIISFQSPQSIYLSNSDAKELSAKYSAEFGVAKTPGWKNKLFVKADMMPHQIRITNIRLERLRDISDDDCLKEGIKKSWWMGASGKYLYGFGEHEDKWKSPKEAYAALIDRVSGKGTWEKNPWVFAYDFELVK